MDRPDDIRAGFRKIATALQLPYETVELVIERLGGGPPLSAALTLMQAAVKRTGPRQWVSTPPEAEGWYWLRVPMLEESGDKPEVVNVTHDAGGLRYVEAKSTYRYPLNHIPGAEWCGPLVAPA